MQEQRVTGRAFANLDRLPFGRSVDGLVNGSDGLPARGAGGRGQWWRVEAAMEGFLGLGCTGWAGHPLGVGDREGGEHSARGARDTRDERRGVETGGGGGRGQEDRAGGAG